MSSIVKNHALNESPAQTSVVGTSTPVTRVFIPLVTPFLYGMRRAIIELFDSLRQDWNRISCKVIAYSS